MRAVVVALAVVLAPAIAAAEAPAPPIVWKNQIRRATPGVVPALVSNKLYLNQRDGTFKDGGLASGLALSRDGRARDRKSTRLNSSHRP